MVECSYTVVWYVHVTLTLFVFCNCLDVKKMPLGKISKGQIAKGFDALEEIEKVLNSKKTAKLPELTSDFYTVIPHDFGRQRPPVINNAEALQQKKDMLMVIFMLKIAVPFQYTGCDGLYSNSHLYSGRDEKIMIFDFFQ